MLAASRSLSCVRIVSTSRSDIFSSTRDASRACIEPKNFASRRGGSRPAVSRWMVTGIAYAAARVEPAMRPLAHSGFQRHGSSG